MSQATEQIAERQNKSGQEIARENVEKVQKYLDDLKLHEKRLPSRYGKPNWTKIASECGLKDRGIFYDNDTARALVEQAVSDIGLETQEAGSKRAAYTEQRLDVSERNVQRLTEKLAVVTAEKEELNREVKTLKERLRQYEVIEEVMTTNGRRFIP